MPEGLQAELFTFHQVWCVTTIGTCFLTDIGTCFLNDSPDCTFAITKPVGAFALGCIAGVHMRYHTRNCAVPRVNLMAVIAWH
jgi:hypothetical protein